MIRALSNLFSRPKRADPIRQGFTLIEVITAVVLIAALAAVAIPVFMQRTRASRAEADVGELEALRTGLLLFYTDVGRIPATLEYLYKIPASPTDICGVSIPTLNQNRFRGPYVTRQIYQLGGGLTSYPLATGDSVETILTPTTINGQSVAQIALYGPEKDIVDLIDLKMDGTVDANNGVITYSAAGGGPLSAQYTVRFNIPMRSQGC